MNNNLHPKKSENKKRTKRGILLTLATTLGVFGEHQINETTQHRHSAIEYVQNRSALNYLNNKEEVFYNWQVVKNNPNMLKKLLDEIFATKYEQVDQTNIEQFVEIRKQLLKNLVSILKNQYSKGSPEYNEMLNKVIPSMVEYLRVETDVLSDSVKETEEFIEYRKEIQESR